MNKLNVFKAGDRVTFKGITVGNITLGPRSGVLRKNDDNTTVRGVTSIIGDKDQLLFNPDGTIYCHSQHGVLLSKVRSRKGGTLKSKTRKNSK
jgi:hypothetical protein